VSDPSSSHSVVAAFLATARGRLITALTVVVASLGIAAEGFSIYQSWQQIRINTYQIEIKEAESCVTRVNALGQLASGDYLGKPDPPAKKQIHEECNSYLTPQEAAKASSPAVTTVQLDTADQIKTRFKAYKTGKYSEAYQLARSSIPDCKTVDARSDVHVVGALYCETSLARHALSEKEFPVALEAAERALSIDPTYLLAKLDKANALMFLGRTSEAKELYLKLRDDNSASAPGSDFVLRSFERLRSYGLTHPLMTEIESEFK
jgi:hypothetical protein